MEIEHDGCLARIGIRLGYGTKTALGWKFAPSELSHMRELRKAELKRQFVDNFWKKTTPEPNTGCLLWTGGVDRDGYGKVGAGPQTRRTALRANRVAWELSVGEIPAGKLVLHRCDSPLCVNAEGGHLYLGDLKDNARDRLMRRRGRWVRRAFLAGVVQ